jgi:hypothetical protein
MEFTFDPASVAEKKKHETVPDGIYPVEVTATEWRQNREKTGWLATIEFTIMGDSFAGRKVWSNFNLRHTNPAAVEMAEREFKSFSKVCGQHTAYDDINLPMGWMLRVKLVPSNREGDKDVKEYLPLKDGNEPSGSEFPPPARDEPDEVVAASESGKKPW